MCLFIIAFVGSFTGLEPFVCCKRAVIGAIGAYIAAIVLVNIINSIMISAFVRSRMKQQQKDVNGRGY